ncbi:unnamed protein product [Hapterophycus canaliculatus]
MAEDGMSAAEATAKRLQDQAAALRESAAASEAEIRPPSGEAEKVAEKPAPQIRPEDMPPPRRISNDMKERLKKELVSQGADPNKSAGNPILIVAGIIAVLVIVGGQGIFY